MAIVARQSRCCTYPHKSLRIFYDGGNAIVWQSIFHFYVFEHEFLSPYRCERQEKYEKGKEVSFHKVRLYQVSEGKKNKKRRNGQENKEKIVSFIIDKLLEILDNKGLEELKPNIEILELLENYTYTIKKGEIRYLINTNLKFIKPTEYIIISPTILTIYEYKVNEISNKPFYIKEHNQKYNLNEIKVSYNKDTQEITVNRDLYFDDKKIKDGDEKYYLDLLKYLKQYPGTVIFVSHEKEFINSLATQIYNIEDLLTS